MINPLINKLVLEIHHFEILAGFYLVNFGDTITRESFTNDEIRSLLDVIVALGNEEGLSQEQVPDDAIE